MLEYVLCLPRREATRAILLMRNISTVVLVDHSVCMWCPGVPANTIVRITQRPLHREVNASWREFFYINVNEG